MRREFLKELGDVSVEQAVQRCSTCRVWKKTVFEINYDIHMIVGDYLITIDDKMNNSLANKSPLCPIVQVSFKLLNIHI